MVSVLRAVLDLVRALYLPHFAGKSDGHAIYGVNILVDGLQQRDGVSGHDAGVNQLAADEARRDVLGFPGEAVIFVLPIFHFHFRHKHLLAGFCTSLDVVSGNASGDPGLFLSERLEFGNFVFPRAETNEDFGMVGQLGGHQTFFRVAVEGNLAECLVGMRIVS